MWIFSLYLSGLTTKLTFLPRKCLSSSSLVNKYLFFFYSPAASILQVSKKHILIISFIVIKEIHVHILNNQYFKVLTNTSCSLPTCFPSSIPNPLPRGNHFLMSYLFLLTLSSMFQSIGLDSYRHLLILSSWMY